MRRSLLLFLFALPACPSDLLDYVMPEARVVMGINLQRMRESRLGQAIWSRLAAQSPEYDKLIRSAGFDPLRDIREILAASPGVNRRQSGLMLVRGSFDAGRLLALGKQQGGIAQNWRGVEVLVRQSKEGSMALAIPEASLIVAGDPLSVRQALAGSSRPVRLAPGLRETVAALGARYDAWVVSIVPLAELAAEAPDPRAAAMLQGDALKTIEQFSGGLRIGAGIEFSLAAVARTAQDAEALAGLARFFAGMARSKETAVEPEIKVAGNTVQFSLSIPEREVEKMLAAGGPAPQPPPATGVTIYSSPGDMGVKKLPPKP